MKKLLFFLSFIAILLSSCQHERMLPVEITSIPLEWNQMTRYKAWTIFEDANGIYFMAKEHETDSLQLYKEANNGFTLHRMIEIPHSYIDTMKDEMNSDKFQLVPVNQDTLIIFTRHTISLLDLRNGAMLKHYSYNHDSDLIVIVDRAGPLRWNTERKVLPVMIVRFDEAENDWDWDTEFAAEFSLETGKLNILPITYPRERCYTNYILSGLRPDPMITYGNGKYLLGFQSSPTMFVYDIRSGKKDSICVKNPMYKPYPDYYDTLKLVGEAAYLQQMMRSAICDFYFTELMYDPYKSVCYRFFLRDLPEKDKNGKTNEFVDKEIGFSVIDNGLKVVGDAHWQMKEASSSAWYATSKGIYGFTHGCIGEKCTNKRMGNIIRINWKIPK